MLIEHAQVIERAARSRFVERKSLQEFPAQDAQRILLFLADQYFMQRQGTTVASGGLYAKASEYGVSGDEVDVGMAFLEAHKFVVRKDALSWIVRKVFEKADIPEALQVVFGA